MKVNLDQKILDLKGQEIPFAPDESLTLKTALLTAVLTPLDGEAKDGPAIYDRYRLSLAFNGGGEIDLTAEQVAMLKDRVSKVFPTWTMGVIWDLLEGTSS